MSASEDPQPPDATPPVVVRTARVSWGSLFELDARLSERLRLDGQRSSWRGLAAFLAHSGDSWFWMAGLALVWLIGGTVWRGRAALMAVGVAGLAGLVLAIKFLVRRRRPEGEWGAIYRNTDPHSFPSGHAARAFMLAVIACGAGPFWLAAVLLLWAPLVGLARVQMRLHYLSDVAAGALLGIIFGLAVLRLKPFLFSVIPFLFH